MKIASRAPKADDVERLRIEMQASREQRKLDEVAARLRLLVHYHEACRLNVNTDAVDSLMKRLAVEVPGLRYHWELLMNPATFLPINCLNVWVPLPNTIIFCKFKFDTYEA